MSVLRLFCLCLIAALCSCDEEESFPNQVGEWQVLETIRRTEDHQVVYEAFSEYMFIFRADGTGETIVNGSSTKTDWWVHNDNKNIVLIKIHGSGIHLNTFPIGLNIEIDERNRQVWAQRFKFMDAQLDIEMDEIYELDRIN